MHNGTILSLVMEYWVTLLVKFSQAFGVLMYINFVLILLFSILWGIFLIRTLWKDYRKEKMNSKLRNTVPEYQWINTMNNFRSNRIKNVFLLSICSCEIGISVLILSNSLVMFILILVSNIERKIQYLIEGIANFASYDVLERSTPTRLYSIGILTTACLLTTLVRILTQYMIYQYSYYKPHLNLKFEIYISISFLFFLLLTETILLKIFYVCIVFMIFYEYILLVIASRKLCLLLKQRLSDAIIHENQSKYAILYYRIGYKDYKICSIVMLMSLFAQCLGISLYCFNTLFSSENLYPLRNMDVLFIQYIRVSYFFINAMELFLITIGTSIQILVYSIVSIRRLFRYIKSRINVNRQINSQRSYIQSIIERNYMAYRMKNQFRNSLCT